MFIERIDVEKFGALDRVVVDRLGPGVQVLHGTNETGKTTLLEFVRAIFFGFEGNFRRGVLDPRVACAGRLFVRVPPERTLLAIERRHEGPHLAGLSQEAYADDVIGLGGDEGDLIAIDDVDPRHADSAGPRHRYYLQDVVGGIDETTFTNVMAFGLDELHELRTLEPEGCGSRLYELASGLDRSHVARVLTHLKTAITRLDSTDPDVSPLTALKARRAALLERLAASLAELRCDGVEIIPQTMPPFPWHFGGQRYHNLFVDADCIESFCRQQALRVCLDVSHSKLACNHLREPFSRFLERILPFTAHLHLADAAGVDGEGLQIDEGDVDWPQMLSQLTRLAPGASFIPEIWQGHKNNGEGAWLALERLERHQLAVGPGPGPSLVAA